MAENSMEAAVNFILLYLGLVYSGPSLSFLDFFVWRHRHWTGNHKQCRILPFWYKYNFYIKERLLRGRS